MTLNSLLCTALLKIWNGCIFYELINFSVENQSIELKNSSTNILAARPPLCYRVENKSVISSVNVTSARCQSRPLHQIIDITTADRIEISLTISNFSRRVFVTFRPMQSNNGRNLWKLDWIESPFK